MRSLTAPLSGLFIFAGLLLMWTSAEATPDGAATGTTVAADATASEVSTSGSAATQDIDLSDIKPSKLPQGVDPQDTRSILSAISVAAKGGHWALLIGLVLMLLTRLFNALLKSAIPSTVLPWVAIGLGIATEVVFSIAYKAHWIDVIIGGIVAGLVAAGSYSAYGKYLPAVKPKPAAGK